MVRTEPRLWLASVSRARSSLSSWGSPAIACRLDPASNRQPKRNKKGARWRAPFCLNTPIPLFAPEPILRPERKSDAPETRNIALDFEAQARFVTVWQALPGKQAPALARQYFGTVGSTRSAQALIPPARLCTFLNPACCRNATALALRPPILQWNTISRLESSSLTRLGKSFNGIKCPPMLQIWYSCGSR